MDGSQLTHTLCLAVVGEAEFTINFQIDSFTILDLPVRFENPLNFGFYGRISRDTIISEE